MFGSSQAFTQGGDMGFGSTQVPSATPEKKQRVEEKQTCLPVTIRAMETAVAQRAAEGGDDFKFYGLEPTTLILVAAVESVVLGGTSLELSLNDGTGRIKARYFVTDPQPGLLESIVPGRYVSVFGNVRAAPAMHFSINGIRLVESADEVSYHMIEVAHSALRLQMPQKEVSAPTPSTFAAEGMPTSTPQKMEVDGASDMKTPQLAPQVAKPAGSLSGAELRAALLEKVRGAGGEEGLSRSALLAAFKPAPETEVRDIIDGLVGDGELFNTIDDDHFAAV